MVISGIESLILEQGLDDALARAKAYIAAGTDGIMIHSKAKTPDEILAFCREYASFREKRPLVVVPSTYNAITEQELSDAGANIIIHANHLLRSSYPSMYQTAECILRHSRSLEASDQYCMPIKEIITLFDDK